MKRLANLAMLLALGACGGDRGEDDPLWCGDVDGEGGETGNVPNVLGDWYARLGDHFESVQADEDEGPCEVPDLHPQSIGFLEGTLAIRGNAPDGLHATLDEHALHLDGIMAPTGGITLSGQHETGWAVLTVAVGGLTFEDPYIGNTIQGFVYVGVDAEDDDVFECHAWADWRASEVD